MELVGMEMTTKLVWKEMAMVMHLVGKEVAIDFVEEVAMESFGKEIAVDFL